MPYFATKDGCRVYYEMQGGTSSKPVVVFLNGTLQDTRYWKPHARALKEHFQVLRYDARAQGQSELGQKGQKLEGHAADLAGLLNHLEVEKAHLVGLSHGAKVALAFAAIAPQRVARLVLCSISADTTCRARLIVSSWLQVLKRSGLEAMVWVCLPLVFGEAFLKQKERILDSIVKAIVARNTEESLVAQLEAWGAYPPLSQIARNVHAPCLIISASDDPMVTEEGARRLAGFCRGDHEHIVGIGHSIAAEAPGWFNKTVLAFLRSDGRLDNEKMPLP
jgi:3-oxoadipate enol-lactonase